MQRIGLVSLLVALAAAILLVGALGLRAAAIGPAPAIALVLLAEAGVALPLALLLYQQRDRRRLTSAALALSVALVVNVAFAAGASQVMAVTDNSSVFTFESGGTFTPPNPNLSQNYMPTSPTATTCPSSAGFDWQCSWTSDTFTSGQTMEAGTAQVDLYAGNESLGIVRKSQGGIQQENTNCHLGRPTVATGDVLIASCTFRGGTGVTVTSVPSGWSLVARVDNGTTISTVVYSHVVTDPSSEPSQYVWDLSASAKLLAYLMNFSGLDTTAPIDAEASQATPSDTSHAAPSVTTTVADGRLLTFHATAQCVTWTPPPGMTQILDSSGCTQGASSNVDVEINELSLGAIGATGPKTATNDVAAVGVTNTIALRPVTAPLTCALTVQLSKPIYARATDSNVSSSASLVLNTPPGVVDGDLMVTSLGYGLAPDPHTLTGPAGWTLVRHVQLGVTNHFGVAVYWRVAASEPAGYTWTFSQPVNSAGGITAYVNVDTATPVSVESGGAGGALSVTTTQPGEMLVVTSLALSNTTFTAPPGMNERFDRVSGSSNIGAVEQADVVQAIAGPSGPKPTTPAASANVILALRPAPGSFLGSTTANVTGAGPTLTSVSIATPAVTFATGDRLQVDVTAPDDQQNCGASISYDSTASPSKLTVAAIVVAEGLAGLLLLAPGLPAAARWWKRHRP